MDLLMPHKDILSNEDLIEIEKVGRKQGTGVLHRLKMCIPL
jgi:hypothetical protein